MNKFEDMRVFNAVVETGSFTAAADRLDSDKSAVSRRVAALEERLGAQLLRRTTRTLNITETGRSFYEHSARLLADLDEAESAVAQKHGELRGRLRISLPLSFGLRHMCKPVSEFNKRHPEVRFDLDVNDRLADLIQDNIDVAVRIGRLADSSLIARRLFHSRVIVAASPDYLARHGTPTSPEALVEHHCLVYSNLPDADQWVWHDKHGMERRCKVNVAMSANNGDLLSQAATDGLGLVIQPTFIAHQFVRSGALVPVLTDVRWPDVTAHAVYPQARHLSYRVRAFIDFLADYFDGVPYWDKDCEGEDC